MALPTLVNKIFAFNIAASKNESNNKKKRAMWRVYDRLANMLQHWKAVTAIALCGVLPRPICLTYYSIFRQEVQTFKLAAAVAVDFFPHFASVFVFFHKNFVLFVPNGVDFNLKISVELFKERNEQTI